MKNNSLLFFIIICHIFFSCSTTKYVEQGDYLLNRNNIQIEKKSINTESLYDYISQKPNADILFFSKTSLHIYSLSGRDTSKWINRVLRKIGSAPIIYDESLTENTERQLRKRMQNLGYLNARVTHCADSSNKKINITYCIFPEQRYTINQFQTDFDSYELRALTKTKSIKRLLKVKENEPFVSEKFDEMSSEITKALWNMGYYYLSKENFYFLADTTIGNHKVDVTLKYRKISKDTLDYDPALQRYRFRNVIIRNGNNDDLYNVRKRKKNTTQIDTLLYNDLKIINGEEVFLRSSVLYHNIFIRPNRFYSDRLIENTYNSLNSLGAVKQVGVQLDPIPDSTMIDATITLTPSNLYYFQFGIDGTNTAGDLGVASYISFQQRNLFKGSEVLNLKLNGAFEHIRGNTKFATESGNLQMPQGNFYEYGGEISLSIPRIILDFLPQKYRKQVGASTVFSFAANWMNRPEYDRRFLSLDWKYTWYTKRKRFYHTLDLYNINYVVSPWTSNWFQRYLEQSGNELLRESYKDQFITRSSYSIVYTSDISTEIGKKGWTIRTGIDIAGTLPYLICSVLPVDKKEQSYAIIGTPFAQYSKVNFDLSKQFFLKEKSQLVAHLGVGLAIPYGNSDVMPYEQRFFAGGANTIRGWSTRSLGPGTFNPEIGGNFITQTGDIKLISNLEYRQQTNTLIDLAIFLDAGNVWTIKDYEKQAGGQFSLDHFYKELGFSWGIGIRPNFKFMILRLDAGMQIYNPSSAFTNPWVITQPAWKRCALHFAVGYPF